MSLLKNNANRKYFFWRLIMKKLTFLLVIGVLFAGNIFAQGQRPIHQRPENRQVEAETITINGTLKLERGLIAIQGEGERVFYIPFLNRFAGFINGLSEGNTVTVEGLRFRNVIQPTKVTIDDRTYDFPLRNLTQGRNLENFRNNQNQFRAEPRQNPNSNHQRLNNQQNRGNQHNRHSHQNRGHGNHHKNQKQGNCRCR